MNYLRLNDIWKTIFCGFPKQSLWWKLRSIFSLKPLTNYDCQIHNTDNFIDYFTISSLFRNGYTIIDCSTVISRLYLVLESYILLSIDLYVGTIQDQFCYFSCNNNGIESLLAKRRLSPLSIRLSYFLKVCRGQFVSWVYLERILPWNSGLKTWPMMFVLSGFHPDRHCRHLPLPRGLPAHAQRGQHRDQRVSGNWP